MIIFFAILIAFTFNSYQYILAETNLNSNGEQTVNLNSLDDEQAVDLDSLEDDSKNEDEVDLDSLEDETFKKDKESNLKNIKEKNIYYKLANTSFTEIETNIFYTLIVLVIFIPLGLMLFPIKYNRKKKRKRKK